MVLLDYIINLSIFSLLVSTPLVIGSFINHKPMRHWRYWVGVYAGFVSVVLIKLSFQQQGYSYDIRYAPVILTFVYFGPLPGIITGIFALVTRLLESGQWTTAIFGWTAIIITLSIIHFVTKRLSCVKRSVLFYAAYVAVYIIIVPVIFHVFSDKPLFHIQYLLFVMLGVIIGVLLIESYEKLVRLNRGLSDMYRLAEASEAKYRLIAENTSDLIMLMNKEHAISYLSPSHEHVLGYPCSELEKHRCFMLLHPDDKPMFLDVIKGMFEYSESQSVEIRLKHKDGHWIEFESKCMPVKGEEDTVENIVIISRDISERKKSEEVLLQSEKLSIVGELAAGVAHEIRNPLTTIKGFVQLYKAENSSIVYNDLLLSELERIESITSELLSLGKPQAVKLDQVNLGDLLVNTVELLSPQANMNNIQFDLKLDGGPFIIKGEKNQLKQVFLNVIKNAIEAMPVGGDIQIRMGKDGANNCMIWIQDHGFGIPEELLPRLGEPFYSLKEKGTGLGVMICHKILKQHNGSITYKSKLNEGTKVEIKLPLVS
ncbi:ATP-binding protein [Bacillus sp. AFS037270]|uniref:ATP-binding protein n=1 Tax=Bacillus sp. AFS037270 TaxID=2033499 RepID=UPI000BFD080A|nr:ATP-binding protein [Bacillus sp. AFS037270]PGV55772.1 PAS domain-containing sensor histidine kinase [Bacillus sp. AFS037270]